MSKTSLQKFRATGIIISRATWFILIYAITVVGILLFFTIQLDKVSEYEIETLENIDVYHKTMLEAVNGIYEIIDNDPETRTAFGEPVIIELAVLNRDYKRFIAGFPSVSSLDKNGPDSLFYSLVEVKKYHSNIEGIGILAMDNNGGLIDNQDIFKTQLRNSLSGLTNALSQIRTQSSGRLEERNMHVYWMTIFQIVSFVFLSIYGYFRVINPFKRVFRETRRLSLEFKNRTQDGIKQIENSLKSEKESGIRLKIKQAEVLKLQDSLEESIQQIGRLSKERSFIYLNSATELEGYLKVVNLQKEILENQTNIHQNESWTTLNGAITQLNALVGDNFNKSKQSINSIGDSEVYLSQLISEIILSSSANDETKFEQVADMPSIKTDVSSLKGALRPYFEMISKYESSKKINVSAYESGAVCEFKFVGLSRDFIEKMEILDQKKSIDLGYNEFKIFMAKKSIINRGGKVWGQQDVVNKGVFCIRWVL